MFYYFFLTKVINFLSFFDLYDNKFIWFFFNFLSACSKAWRPSPPLRGPPPLFHLHMSLLFLPENSSLFFQLLAGASSCGLFCSFFRLFFTDFSTFFTLFFVKKLNFYLYFLTFFVKKNYFFLLFLTFF